MPATRIGKALGLKNMATASLIQAVKSGISWDAVRKFFDITGLSQQDLARYLAISERTFARSREAGTFDHRESEQVLRLPEGVCPVTLQTRSSHATPRDRACPCHDAGLPSSIRGPWRQSCAQTGAPPRAVGIGQQGLVQELAFGYARWLAPEDRAGFLPFNKGDHGGAGNPPSPSGHLTSYLWEEVWERESFLDILGRYLVTEKDDKKKLTRYLFPRYHQLDATRKLLRAVEAEGVGGKYLIQHSAGSGKTNSIAWTAHFFADLHNADHKKVFDSVIVVSDRNVIDQQLQDAIRRLYALKRLAFSSRTSRALQSS
jgi:hypothetical protein